jgi:hypothetical protein
MKGNVATTSIRYVRRRMKGKAMGNTAPGKDCSCKDERQGKYIKNIVRGKKAVNRQKDK